jgi:hypothetical protein
MPKGITTSNISERISALAGQGDKLAAAAAEAERVARAAAAAEAEAQVKHLLGDIPEAQLNIARLAAKKAQEGLLEAGALSRAHQAALATLRLRRDELDRQERQAQLEPMKAEYKARLRKLANLLKEAQKANDEALEMYRVARKIAGWENSNLPWPRPWVHLTLAPADGWCIGDTCPPASPSQHLAHYISTLEREI